MKVDLINPFVFSTFRVLENYGKYVTKGTLLISPSPIEGKEINVVVGITGDVKGQVIYSMTTHTAINVASLLMGMTLEDLNEISQSAISELGNMITGNAATELSRNDYSCCITPPTLFMGRDTRISIKDAQILVIPIFSDFGEITIYTALREADRKKTA